jgi:hypothetical protein
MTHPVTDAPFAVVAIFYQNAPQHSSQIRTGLRNNTACSIDRLADLVLAFGSPLHAEHLSRRAADLREAVR